MKRYTISNFIKITVILTAIFVFQGFAALIYMLFHNASIIYIAANIIMCIAGGSMSQIGQFFSLLVNLMQIKFSLFGYELTLYSVFVFTVIGGIVLWLFHKFFDILSD